LGFTATINPSKNKTSFLKGIMISPSIRFWSTISSTLEGNSYNYLNKNTGKSEEIKTLDIGPGFTPFIYNISIGYSFGLKKK
jgi:hypothetical protein